MFFLPMKQKYIEHRNFHRVVYKLLALNGTKQPILTSFRVAMATTIDVIWMPLC